MKLPKDLHSAMDLMKETDSTRITSTLILVSIVLSDSCQFRQVITLTSYVRWQPCIKHDRSISCGNWLTWKSLPNYVTKTSSAAQFKKNFKAHTIYKPHQTVSECEVPLTLVCHADGAMEIDNNNNNNNNTQDTSAINHLNITNCQQRSD